MEFTLDTFKQVLGEEPELLPFGVGECLKDIFRYQNKVLPRPDKSVQSTINNHMCRLGRKYNPTLVNMAATGKDNFIFDSARLMPLVSLEWLLATLELTFHHGHAMGWLGSKLKNKTIRVLSSTYGDIFCKDVLDCIKEYKDISKFNWNYTLYDFIECYVDGVFHRRLESSDRSVEFEIKRHTRNFINILLNAFGFTWGAKELLDLESMALDFANQYNRKDACSMIYLTMISFMGPNTKTSAKPIKVIDK